MIKPFYNLHLKILALLSAIILWFFVVGIENMVYSLPESLEVQPLGIGKTVSLAGTLPKVKLYLRVDKEILKTLTKNDFEVSVDLADLTSGEHKVTVSAISKNAQVSVLKVEPGTIDIKLAPLSEKEVDVAVSFLGNPREGYTVKEITAEFEKVKIVGAQTVIDKIDSVKAELLLDGTQTGDIKQTVTLRIPELSGVPKDSVKTIPEQILISAVIVAEMEQKVVQIKPVITGAADPNTLMNQIMIDPPAVTVQGEEKYLKAISFLETKSVDAQDLIKRTVPLKLELVLPENVSLLNPNQNVTIALKAQPNEQKSVFAPLIFTRENQDFKVKKVTPSEIKITVAGPSSVIKNLKNGDVTVNINLQNVGGAGPLLINTKDIIVPVGLEIINFEPAQVELETT